MRDPIERQDAIKAMVEDKIQTKIYITSTAERDFEVFNGACDRHAKMLKELPSAQQWIPCSERLPEKDDIYIVCFDKGHLMENEIQVETAYWLNNKWQYSCLESYEHRMPRLVIEPIEELSVTAWMPLPEPYGEEP